MAAEQAQETFEVYNVETGKARVVTALPGAIRECFADPSCNEVHDIRSSPTRIFRRVQSAARVIAGSAK